MWIPIMDISLLFMYQNYKLMSAHLKDLNTIKWERYKFLQG